MIKISPSVLSGDFANLERDIRTIAQSGADYVHVDVMDGMFVPNITIGIPVVGALSRVSPLPLDVHLMIQAPLRYVEAFCQAGANVLTVHVEADAAENTRKALMRIRQLGAIPGLSLKPATPVRDILPFLDLCGLVLVMAVEPGFGGQKFLGEVMPKLAEIAAILRRHNPQCLLEVDGGVNLDTFQTCLDNGATVLVAGSAFFQSADRGAFVRTLRGGAATGLPRRT